MRFLVDGYNVTMADGATRRLPKDAQRDALVRRLSARGAELLGPGAVTVVFDGRAGQVSQQGAGPVDVRFSRDEPADEVIVRLASAEDGAVVLVSSDRRLAERVQAAATGRVTVRGRTALFEAARGRRRPAGKLNASTIGVPKGGNRITEELKKLWLQDEE
jgi:predicted RNA-binding protein with PIN domain